MRCLYVCFALFTCLYVSGCVSTVQVDTEYDPQYDFSGYLTYAWHDQVRAPSEIVEDRIRTAVETAFTSKGYSRVVSGEKPEFLVSFSAVAEQAIRADSISTGMGYRRRGWGMSTSTRSGFREYTRGTLIIDIIEPTSKNLLWRGVSSAALYQYSSVQEKDQLVNETVTAMLAKFPPDSK